MSKESDRQLIDDYLQGNQLALDSLIKEHFQGIYRFIFYYVNNQLVAEDLTQEVFLKVWRNLKKYQPEKKFSSWLLTIAKNTALDYLKKKKELVWSDFEDQDGNNFLTDSLIDPEPLPNIILEQAETKQLITNALADLSAPDRAIILLYYKEQLNLREIAETLVEPLNTVKSRYRRGLIKLKEIILANQSKTGLAPKNPN